MHTISITNRKKQLSSKMNKLLLHVYNSWENYKHYIPYQYLFLNNIPLCYCTDAFHMYIEGDIKPHIKEMDMSHRSEDHNTRQDTLALRKNNVSMNQQWQYLYSVHYFKIVNFYLNPISYFMCLPTHLFSVLLNT